MASFYSQIENFYSLLDIEENSDEDDFFSSVVAEVESEDVINVFTCDCCGKSLKTERGFKRHKQKHEEKQADSTSAQLFDVAVWKQLIQKSVNKVVEEDLQCDRILEELKAFSLTSSDAEQCLPHFIEVISSNVCNSENFYPKFYKAVTQLDTFCGLSKKCSTVVGFELANHVLAYYKSRSSSVLSVSSQEFCVDLSEREVVVVVYIAGYVFGQLYRRIRKSRLWESDLCQQKLSLLKAGKIEAVETDDRYKLVKCRDRGGLWYVGVDVIGIFTETEKDFKLQTQNMTLKIDFDKIVKNVVTIAYVQSCIANIPVDNEALQNFLEQIVLQYVRVRERSSSKVQAEVQGVES